MANEKQNRLLLHVIYHLLSSDNVPFQIFFTGPAGCGKTFVIKLLMEIYNRYTDNGGYCNAYITCASTVTRQANQQFSSILTKIGNGERLDEIEISLIKSRFYSVEEAGTMCPQEKIISTAKDVYSGCTSKEQETFVHQKLHKVSLIDTNGLPYQTTFAVNIYYMITTNIDASDGLANGPVGKLVHAETDNNGVVTIAWLEFPELPRIGEKLRRKAAGHAAENNIS
ncbi:ATP-dependent DNA helicase [Trichonephila clavipes]|nr:ATP-dependent DNA helicase [Trichonephila clavipes]